MKIDSHQHFWKFNPVRDSWINEDMKVLQRDYLPKDILPLLSQNSIDGCIAVQADQSESETDYLLILAGQNNFIKGVVGWIDLRAENLPVRLEYYSQFKHLKGFRHILQAEPELDFMLDKSFCNGINHLKKYEYTYDILIFPQHLPYACELVKRFQDQKFIIDHMAKPDIKNANFDQWSVGINKIAQYPNVYCKVSGLVTEADWKSWKKEDFYYFLDNVVAAFGVSRLMFGSDWPVSLLAASYHDVLSIPEQYFYHFSETEKADFWGGNARAFYNLV